MSHLEVIKDQFHDLIDRVQDEAVLVRYLGAIASEIKGESADLWNDLTPKQQKDVLEAVDQTNDPSRLISHQEAIKRHAPWRIR
ncbi:hypothetical protein [Spirosoma spitsbergense]|jgi:hypothetical protein|uniref:hypothetical protein n=1 Tax=Spirosoma spitsbergense TaxID=431554 RepID=UPI000371AC34|nr:hypothetical protein [Spirosoma spitsbergense]